MEAFGAQMVRSEGGESDFFRDLYLEMVQLKRNRYDLPFKEKFRKDSFLFWQMRLKKEQEGYKKREVE